MRQGSNICHIGIIGRFVTKSCFAHTTQPVFDIETTELEAARACGEGVKGSIPKLHPAFKHQTGPNRNRVLRFLLQFSTGRG